MIKLIKITRKYIKWAYTTEKHNLIFGIPLLQEWWRWHCYLHLNYICLNIHQATFDYSNLEANISKTKNDRNKRISDSESWHLGGNIWVKRGSHCTKNIHAQRDVQKHCFIYPHTTLSLRKALANFCVTVASTKWNLPLIPWSFHFCVIIHQVE